MKVYCGFINSAEQFHSKDQVILDAKYVTQKSNIKFFLFFSFFFQLKSLIGMEEMHY